jgi:hypothetical protein
VVRRLATRTTNAYGKHPAEVADTLRYLVKVEPLLRESATAEISTVVPVSDVADAVLRLGL